MRIDNNGVTINPEMPLDEAAQHVINALDAHIQHLVRSEREACAKVCETLGEMNKGVYGEMQIGVYSAAKSIRARGDV